MQAENGMAVGGGLANAGGNAISQPNHAQQNDVNDMQAKLDQLKGL